MKVTNKYIFFFGEEPFSNFTPCLIRYGSNTFISSEQLFMYKKAVFFGDMNTASKILMADSPKEAKRLGRKVKPFDAEEWSKVSFDIMKNVVALKFEQNPRLRNELLKYSTGTFVEASPWDRIWGIGFNENEAIQNEERWGKNLLGKILTDIRDEN